MALGTRAHVQSETVARRCFTSLFTPESAFSRGPRHGVAQLPAKQPRMTKTPASLLERLRDSFDADAWARFVALYTPLIYSWGRCVGLQDQDAADLVQDVFATLIQVLP